MTAVSRNARVAGIIYIVASLVGIVRLLYIPKALFVHGDTAATAHNIATHASLFQLGIAAYLVGGVLWLFVPLALYRLFKDVDRTLAILMVIFGGLMQTPLYLVNTATDGAALKMALTPGHEEWVRLFLDMHHQIDLAGMMFAGIWLFPFGLLVYKSGFLPRFLGVWLMLDCFAWLTFSMSGFISPGLDQKVFTYMQPLAFAEVVIMFWLAIAGAKQKPIAVTNFQTA